MATFVKNKAYMEWKIKGIQRAIEHTKRNQEGQTDHRAIDAHAAYLRSLERDLAKAEAELKRLENVYER